MSRSLPLSALAAWWTTAWLRGRASAAEVTAVLEAESAVHTTSAGVPAPWPSEGTGVADLLFALRASGAVAAGCAFPHPGDPYGLRGPAALNVAALEQGEVLLAVGPTRGEQTFAAVPVTVGAGTTWLTHLANPRPAADLGMADRGLRSAVTTAADRLAALDVASWSPDAADGLLNLRTTRAPDAPPGTPDRAVALAARALVLLEVVDVAWADGTGGAVSAHEAMSREGVLDDLARAARHALVAACSADAWPEG